MLHRQLAELPVLPPNSLVSPSNCYLVNVTWQLGSPKLGVSPSNCHLFAADGTGEEEAELVVVVVVVELETSWWWWPNDLR